MDLQANKFTSTRGDLWARWIIPHWGLSPIAQSYRYTLITSV